MKLLTSSSEITGFAIILNFQKIVRTFSGNIPHVVETFPQAFPKLIHKLSILQTLLIDWQYFSIFSIFSEVFDNFQNFLRNIAILHKFLIL